MARCRVTYREAADERPAGTGATVLLDLEVDPTPERPSSTGAACGSPDRAPPGLRPSRRGRWVVGAAAVLLGVAAVGSTGAGDDRPADAPSSEVTHRVATRPGPVVVATRSVVAEPWSGVFEHHPDARGAVSVPHVYLAAISGPGGRALLVVDATRRAFGGPEHPVGTDRSARLLGPVAGTGLRTMQWDEGGYGVSLTSVGLSEGKQRAVAGAIHLPPGPSLQHGRPPDFDTDALADVGLIVTERRSGAASAFGSPFIGQSGGASIEGQLYQPGVGALLVSVVEDQLASAARVRGALGETAALDLPDLERVSAAAMLAHGAGPDDGRRIRGWSRLVLDHDRGVTIELSSDLLEPAQLVEAARAMDLDRLARTTVPMARGPG